MDIERGELGPLPYAAVGDGPPVAVFAGLSPETGFGGDLMLRSSLGPVAPLTKTRRVVLLNRRAALPRGMTMRDMAAEYAQALEALGPPVDVVGISTGGSIAQQFAADHPRLVRRLVLASTACRLGVEGRLLQRRVGARIRGGAPRRALAVMTAGLVPPGRGRTLAACVALLVGGRLVSDGQGLADMATTIEAEDDFNLAGLEAPIQAPTLILAGREDRFYSPELFEETARLIPGSELRILDGRGHVTSMSDKRFRAELLRFLGS